MNAHLNQIQGHASSEGLRNSSDVTLRLFLNTDEKDVLLALSAAIQFKRGGGGGGGDAGHLLDDVYLLLRPEFISFFFHF